MLILRIKRSKSGARKVCHSLRSVVLQCRLLNESFLFLLRAPFLSLHARSKAVMSWKPAGEILK